MGAIRGKSGRFGEDTRCRFAVGLTLFSTLIIITFIGVAGFASPATAALDGGQYDHGENATDDEPPTLANGSRGNATTIELTITDNHDVDEGTISASSFVITPGSINGSSVSESGSDATVELYLADPVDVDNVTVALADGSNVQDTNGNSMNALDEPSLTITGMDGISPDVRSFSATDALGEPSQLTIETTEDLGGINVSILGDSGDWLTESDFTASGTTYETTYEPTTTGGVRFILVNVTDESGNTQPVNIRQPIRADLTPPTAVAGLDLAASSNLTLAFTGERSSDANEVANYTWTFGDGTNATGERVSHTFLPGEYTVTMTATDPFGNAATDSLDVNLTTGSGNVTDVSNEQLQEISRAGGPEVTVEQSDEESALARVRRASAGVPFTISDEATPLAGSDGVSVDTLNVTLARNTSLDLALSATGPEAVSDAAEATGTTALGGVTVVHSVPDEGVESVEFVFTVDASALDSAGASPGDVSLVRRHDGTWQTVSTNVTNARNARNATTDTEPSRFRATTTGFSRFAIVANVTDDSNATTETTDSNATTPTVTATPTATATQTPTDDTGTDSAIRIQSVSLNASSVPPEQPVSVNVTLRNTGGQPDGFVAGLSVNDSVVATQSTTVPPNDTRVVRFEYRTNRTGTFPVAVNGTTAGDLTVGGGGLLSSILGIFGFLPLGLLRPLLLFVAAPLLVLFLLLKGVAFYLGY